MGGERKWSGWEGVLEIIGGMEWDGKETTMLGKGDDGAGGKTEETAIVGNKCSDIGREQAAGRK